MKVVAVLLVCILTKSAQAILEQGICNPNYCITIVCGMFAQFPPHCNGKLVYEDESVCSCCPPCENKRQVSGDACANNAECGQYFHCDLTSHTCVKTTGPCAERLQQFLSSEQHLLGAARPVCKPDGTYSPKQCSGSGCYCVDAKGNNLGYFTSYGSGTNDMDCKCAVHKVAYANTGLIGKLIFCDSKGSFVN